MSLIESLLFYNNVHFLNIYYIKKNEIDMKFYIYSIIMKLFFVTI